MEIKVSGALGDMRGHQIPMLEGRDGGLPYEHRREAEVRIFLLLRSKSDVFIEVPFLG